MSTRDKLGVVILIGLCAMLIGVLAYTARRSSKAPFQPKDSPIVQQRIQNLERSGK